jgi:predicted secreted hydrolase
VTDRRLLLLIYLLLSVTVLTACREGRSGKAAPDLAVLAQSADAYTRADPSRALEFPADHGAHPDFRIEWWYLTANLEDAEGEDYGAQWTLFRLATRPPGAEPAANPWQDGQMYMAHFALSTPQGHRGFQRYARGGEHGGAARAGARAQPFSAWLDDWSLHSVGAEWLPLEVVARQDEAGFRLQLKSHIGPVPQGEGGFSRKHPGGGGSHYYSQPFLEATGELWIDGGPIAVTGQAWLDREWSSQFLQADQSGWDWFALHLDSGEKLMLFQLRAAAHRENEAPFRHAVLISANGATRALDSERVVLEVLETRRVAGRTLPLRWSVVLEEIGRRLEITARFDEQWMDVDFPYWEGVVIAQGEGPLNSGRGYMELTGYGAE